MTEMMASESGIDTTEIAKTILEELMLHDINQDLQIVNSEEMIIFTDDNFFSDSNENIVNCNSMNFNQQFQRIANDMTSPNMETDLSNLIDLRRQNINNPMIGYLNINSLGNKIDYLRDICNKSPLNIFCIDETKIDSSFPDAQFHIDGYQFPPLLKDRNQNGGGKNVYIKEGIITKRLIDLEGKNSETKTMPAKKQFR